MTQDKPPHRSAASAQIASGAGLTCVIGDVHGQIRKLEPLLELCESCAGPDARFVFVGDYVDRGPDAKAVVEALIDLQRRKPSQVICLRGNHEAVVLAAAHDRLHMLPGNIDMAAWLRPQGGGRATLASYGVRHASDLPRAHLDWMASLPLSYDDGLRFFAHAGVHPRRGLAEQNEDDLLWIREPFLSHADEFGRLVVHGHTPVAARVPDMRFNRLNLDTGAGYDGPLTAALFDDRQRDPLAFLGADGEAAVGVSEHAGAVP
jgi:diadenosine tetraphosphatase ApaH/serine/threonine PP2A family protein phosphatase